MSFSTYCKKIINRLASPDMRRMTLILWVFGIFSLADVAGRPVFVIPLWLQWTMIVSIGAFKGILWTTLFIESEKNRFAKAATLCAIVIFTLLCSVNIVSYLLYGFGITHRLIIILAQTNPQEISEFLPGLISNMLQVKNLALTAALICATVALCLSLKYMSEKLWLAICGILTVAGLSSAVYMTCTTPGSKSFLSIYVRTAKYMVNTYQENKKMESLADAGTPFPNPEKIETDAEPVSIIMVLGESVNRNSMSLYGYPLPTSPRFDAMRDSLYVFTDAICSSTATAINLERILTFEDDRQEEGSWTRYPRLIDMLNRSGFKTLWYSNQERVGFFISSSGVIASEADEVKYIGADSSEDKLMFRYDTALLPYFSKALGDTAQKKFIALHLLGSHVNYDNRYPHSEAYFNADSIRRVIHRPWLNAGKAAVMARYANSIRFTDALLEKIIKEVAASRTPAVVIYLSDHGENVYDVNNSLGRSPKCVKVPFVIYANPAYRERHPEITAKFREALSRPFSTANTIYSLMTISGVRHPIYDSSMDVLSPDFKPRTRYTEGGPFEEDKSADPK